MAQLLKFGPHESTFIGVRDPLPRCRLPRLRARMKVRKMVSCGRKVEVFISICTLHFPNSKPYKQKRTDRPQAVQPQSPQVPFVPRANDWQNALKRVEDLGVCEFVLKVL